MSGRTTSDFVVERLHQWGVRRVFGYPGDGINGVMGALERIGSDKIEFIQARHEELAAFMACAHAKFTGEVGVCIATSGPGAIHLLNGLYDARMDHAPVVAIVGQQATTALGSGYQQEVDLMSLFKDVASEFVQMASSPVAVRHLIDRAMRIAAAERTVTCVILPNDIQEEPEVPCPPHAHSTTLTGIGHDATRVVPSGDALAAAAAVLNGGSKVAILVGQGALDSTDEVIELADLLGAGCAKALLGKAVLPDDLPWCTGPIGLLGSEPSWKLMRECDTLLMIGTSFPYVEFLPEPGKARAVQIDRDPRMLSLRYPAEVGLHGDSRATLRALLPLLTPKPDRTWRQSIEAAVAEWWKLLETRAHKDASPINPQRFFWELSPRLPDRCVLTCDSGSAANWYARDLKIRRGMKASLSGNLATMCPGLPYALAAKLAFPDRVPVAILGDGAMQMLGLNSLLSIAKYARRWLDPRFVVVVLNNEDLNMVTWEQRAMSGDPKFVASQSVPRFPYARYAELIGLTGIEITTPEHIVPAIERAFAADRPCLLDVHTDPDVPLLPPHVTREQAKSFVRAMFRGDVDRVGVLRQTIREVASKLAIALLAALALETVAVPSAVAETSTPRAASAFAVIERQSVVVSFVPGSAELEESSHAALGALLASLDPATRRGPVTIVAWPDAASSSKDLVTRRLAVLDALLSSGGAVGPVTRHSLDDEDDPLARAIADAEEPSRAAKRGEPSDLARYLSERGGLGRGAVLVGDASRP